MVLALVGLSIFGILIYMCIHTYGPGFTCGSINTPLVDSETGLTLFQLECQNTRHNWLIYGVRSRSVEDLPGCPKNFDEIRVIYAPATEEEITQLNLTPEQITKSWELWNHHHIH